MAKETKNTVKLNKPQGRIQAGSVNDEDEEDDTQAEASAPVQEGTPELQEKVVAETPAEVSSVLNTTVEDEHKFVTLAVHKLVQPAPVVGKFSFSDHGITELTEGMRVRIPFYVAIHLVDKHVGTIVSTN